MTGQFSYQKIGLRNKKNCPGKRQFFYFMEYALLIDSYRVEAVPKPLICRDNLAYFLGAVLFVVPLTRFSLHFGLFTVFFYCLVFALLNVFDTNLLKLFPTKEGVAEAKAEVKIAIDFKNKNFSFNFLFYVFSPSRRGRVPGLSPPFY